MKKTKSFRVKALILSCALILTQFAIPLSATAHDANDYSNFKFVADRVFRDSDVDAGARVDDIMDALTFDEKVSLTQNSVSANARLGLNSAASGGGGGDRIHGVSNVFPSSLGMSQAWDQKLFWRLGEAMFNESALGTAGSGQVSISVDILRDPRYGRAYETYGEDGFLTGKLATALTQGMNQRDSNGYWNYTALLKHFMGYGTETMRYWLNSSMPLRSQYEYYSKPFYYPISAGGAKSVMTSYPIINGKPMIVSHLLGEMLNEWTPDYKSKAEGGDGATGHYEFRTVNDAYSGSWMYLNQQRYYNDNFTGRTLGVTHAVRMGNMGWSLRNVNSHGDFYYEALARGLMTEDDVYDGARRSITNLLRGGNLDSMGSTLPDEQMARRVGTTAAARAANKELTLEVSQSGIVLLKNDDNILPLKGADTTQAVLLGSLSDTVTHDHYIGTRSYAVSIKTALENKLGAANVKHDRAVDTVAIKASNGQYLAANNTGNTYQGNTATMATITATGGTEKPTSLLGNTAFQIFDYNFWQLLRTPVNGMFVRTIVPSTSGTVGVGTGQFAMMNDTRTPGLGGNNTETGESSSTGSNQVHWTPHGMFRIVPTTDGKFGFYASMPGNGRNMPTQLTGGLQWGGTMNPSNADEEDLNNGSYLGVNGLYNYDGTGTTFPGSSNTANRIEADFRTQGPWMNQLNLSNSKADTTPDDGKVDNLPENCKFEFDYLQSAEAAAQAQIDAAAPGAPIILVLGTESWGNAGEARDLQYTGLGEQPVRLIDYLTKEKSYDIILVLKSGNPMAVQSYVAKNPRVKAILTMGHSSMEEGPALVSVLFDDGTKVPTASSYNGYKGPAGDGVIPARSPAGRLSATWYDGEEQMLGGDKSGTYPPVSYRWPAFDEETNNNLTNVNGSYPAGLQVYDIIEGERTYQYLNGTPLFAFGHGLSYGSFTYSDVAVSAISDGSFTVTGKVTNNGTYTSDEVVEVYSSFVGSSRIKHANKRLIGFERLYNIAPSESREFSIVVTNMRDEMGVYDVEDGELIVENGDYLIRVGGTSELTSLPGNNAILTVTTATGGKTLPARDLNKLTMAEAFDDQSNVGGKVMDIEIVASNPEDYDCDYAVSMRENGSWISFKNVAIPSGTSLLTAGIGSDRTANMKVYALPVGADPDTALAEATPIAVLALADTRAKSGVPTGLGTGGNTNGGGSPGSVRGQVTQDNYLVPLPKTWNTAVTVAGGLYDIYFVAETRGARFVWLKFGASPDAAASVEIFDSYNYNSIRAMNGELQLRAALTPVTAVDSVVWSIESGSDLATIDPATGKLTATGVGNGTVKVKATAGGASVVKDILVTNQLSENKFNGKTIDYIVMRGTDYIARYNGSTTMSARYWSLDDPYPDTSWLAGGPTEIGSAGSATLWGYTWATMAASNLTWKVTDLDGNPTDLATISGAVVTATGAGNGKVKVAATFNNNPDIVTERVITITNQEGNDAFKTIIAAESYDTAAEAGMTGTSIVPGMTNILTYGAATGLATNQTGAYSNIAANNTIVFRDVDFGAGADEVCFRLAGTTSTTITLRIDGTSVTDGTEIVSFLAENSGNNNTYANFGAKLNQVVTGKHHLTVTFSGAARLAYFQFGEFEDEKTPAITDVNYKGFTNLVSGCAANIPVEVTTVNADGLKVFAGVYLDGELKAQAEVIDGKVTIRIEKFDFAEVSVKAWFEDAGPGAEKAIPVKTMAPTLWTPDITESDGVITVAFAESITFAAKKSATVRGAAATGMAIVDGNKLEITGYGEAVSGDNLVIAGIKYPDLFPSYSFTFTLAIE